MLLAAASIAMSVEMFAQQMSLGVLGGGSATYAFEDKFYPDLPGSPSTGGGARFFSPSRDYLIGGTAAVRLTPRWSLQVDGIFRQLHMSSAKVGADGSMSSVSPSPAGSVEVSCACEVPLWTLKVRPFMEGGPSFFRTTGNLNNADPSHAGITFGAGAEIAFRVFTISPGMRYTRWAADPKSADAVTNPNQVEFVVGLSGETGALSWQGGWRMAVGVIAGTNLTGDYDQTEQAGTDAVFFGRPLTYLRSSGPRSLLVGPMVEFKSPSILSVEVDGIYRPVSVKLDAVYSDGNAVPGSSTIANLGSHRHVTWEFPVWRS